MRIEFEGLAELVREAERAGEDLDRNLESSVQDAAEKGLVAFTDQHPYTDQTFNLTASARVEDSTTGVGDGSVKARDMVWGGDDSAAPYAVFLEHRRAYKFTPVARAEAKRVLERDAKYAAELYADKLSGR